MLTPMTADESVDVLIVGAGLSGIGAACQLQRECPQKSMVILEARESVGGTWDLFRYPGVRSDSDMFTLGYRFQPLDRREGNRRREPTSCATSTRRPTTSACGDSSGTTIASLRPTGRQPMPGGR